MIHTPHIGWCICIATQRVEDACSTNIGYVSVLLHWEVAGMEALSSETQPAIVVSNRKPSHLTQHWK